MDLCQEGREQGRRSTQREQRRTNAEATEPGAGRTSSKGKDEAKAMGTREGGLGLKGLGAVLRKVGFLLQDVGSSKGC